MRIEDSFVIDAPIQEVWDGLLDVDLLARCIPGIASLQVSDDQTYTGDLNVTVGPIRASFEGLARFTRLDPPAFLEAEIEGGDRRTASKVKAVFQSQLSENEAGTLVQYSVDINLRGRLAQFGLAVVRGTAKKMTQTFGQCLQDSIQKNQA